MSRLREDGSTYQTALGETRPERRREVHWLADPRRTVVAYVVVYAVVGVVGSYVSLVAQSVFDAVFALVAINHAIFGYRVKRTAGLVMAALFTTRLMVVTLPASGVSLTTRTAIIAGVSCLVAYIASWVLANDVANGRLEEGLALKSPFLTRSITFFVTVAAGVPIGWAAHRLLEPEPLVMSALFGSTVPVLLLAGLALFVGALGEEMVFRRLVAAMVQHTAGSQTPFVSAFLFGAAYLGTRDLAFAGLAFAAGALWAWSCERTGSIRAAVVSHTIVNLMVFMILPG